MNTEKKQNKLQNRQKQYWDSLEKKEEALFSKLEKEYTRQSKKLDTEIAAFYQKYGKDNVIEYNKVLRALSPKEKRMLYEQVEEFFELHPKYIHLKPIRKKIYQLNRLEGLQESIYLNQLELGIFEETEIGKHFSKIYKGKWGEVENATASMSSIDSTFLKDTINKNWLAESDFSKNIWGNRSRLLNTLQNEVRDGFIRGDSYRSLMKLITDKNDKQSRYNAKRLIMTEGTFISNEVQAREFEEDYEYYIFRARMDNKTSKICSDLNGIKFKFKDRQAGYNFPPMHPNCRSGFEVVIDSYKE